MSGQAPGKLFALGRDLVRSQEGLQGRRGRLSLKSLHGKGPAHAQSLNAGRIVGLVVCEGYHELRDAGGQGLGGRPDPAVVDDQG